ncbi:MAG: response regulator [Candidatus Omnitrophica bacterium]|nr:response regulator [Candidatus Omnitrophota bacterium]
MANKVLVVDDEPGILLMVRSRLVKAGYQVEEAKDGQEALKKTREWSPDLVIMDVMMPPPNGFQACRILKDDSATRAIPIVLLTAKSTESDQFWGQESGADAYLTKPYDPQELLATVARLIQKD